VWKAEKSACDVWIKIGKERGLQHSTWRTLTALELGVCVFRFVLLGSFTSEEEK
jgi:hypothetical protein